ncbi:MAG: ABC transporter ATP-binding protein [Candidatus Lokiarchaeota archaeon]|nr:ABC transporter ATP-binding protein [Candidatus Lokiarchaeota archaeon]
MLEVVHLKKYFGDVHAVDDTSFVVRGGEIYGLLGPNGAGKTTTMKCILGLLDIDGGRVSVMGEDPVVDPQAVKASIGYVPEEPLVYKSMTPAELFNFVASIRRVDAAAASRKAMEVLTALDATRHYQDPIITLSRGNQQKIQVVAAMLHEPRLLILDEPTANLDAKSTRIVKEMLHLHVEQGGAVLLSTHVMEQAAELCTRIGIINRGKVVIEGTLGELRAVAKESGASLENMFLRFTGQDKDVQQAVARLRSTNGALGA